MKKFSVYLALVAIAGIAMASSLGIPWFADYAPKGAANPPANGTMSAFIQLKNNTDEDITCEVVYYDGNGNPLDSIPAAPNNTFVIPAFSSSAYRPALQDPIPGLPAPYNTGLPGGQESLNAVKVPDCENSFPGLALGSGTISWQGGPTDIQGAVIQLSQQNGQIFSYSFTLPDSKGQYNAN